MRLSLHYLYFHHFLAWAFIFYNPLFLIINMKLIIIIFMESIDWNFEKVSFIIFIYWIKFIYIIIIIHDMWESVFVKYLNKMRKYLFDTNWKCVSDFVVYVWCILNSNTFQTLTHSTVKIWNSKKILNATNENSTGQRFKLFCVSV